MEIHMHRLLSQLRTDHINTSKLLSLFDKEVEELASSSIEPNYHKWQNILLYMTTYQDIFHHPTEEIIFSSIRERDPILAEKLDEITEQHERLYEKSKTLHRTLSSIETEFISLDKDKLIAECKHYINLLSSHIGIEEKFIFPFAAENLAKADWEAIESKVKLVDDPMFSQKRKAEFAELYECVYAQ